MFDKKCKFQCKIRIVGITQTPYLCGSLYCKLRLLNGDFTTNTTQQTIQNHEVMWNEEFEFKFQALLDKNTRTLRPCILRISVRMESNKSAPNKIGFLDLNLSEFCGFGVHNLRFHLKGYGRSEPPDNSILEIRVDTKTVQGNVIFKPNQEPTPNRILDLNSMQIDTGNEDNIDKPSIEPVHPISSPVPIITRNLYSPWFRGNRFLNDEIMNMNVRGSSKITSTRLDNDQITDNILSNTFLCMQPADSSQLELFMTQDGKPVLGQTLTSPVISDFEPSESNNTFYTSTKESESIPDTKFED